MWFRLFGHRTGKSLVRAINAAHWIHENVIREVGVFVFSKRWFA
jgi:hypothetical protein